MIIRKIGNVAPKGKNQYRVLTRFSGPAQALYGAAQEPIQAIIIWARNPKQAREMADDLDTRDGTAIGWETLGVSPI